MRIDLSDTPLENERDPRWLRGNRGAESVRVQSMTTSNTRDIDATIDQMMRLADAGCEIARVTVQGKKEAEACEGIKTGLLKRGYTIPIVADIHFYPPASHGGRICR